MTIFSSVDRVEVALYQREGIVRSFFPAETLKIAVAIGHRIGVTRVANVTHLDQVGIPVALAIRPNGCLLSVSQGKGLTQELANISALMESIELWHAENLPAAPYFERYDAKASLRFLRPSHLANSCFSSKILDHSFLDWQEGFDLLRADKVLIPREVLNLNSCQRSKTQLLFGASSNGLASGNTLEEALCYGMLEVLERDAYGQFEECNSAYQASKSVDLASIEDPMITALLLKFERAGIELNLYDLSEFHGIPVFSCALYDRHQLARRSNYFMGMGAHYLKNIALVRALTEAAQVRLTYITGSRDDVFPEFYTHTQDSKTYVRGSYDYAKIPELAQEENFQCQLKSLLAHLKARGVEQIAYYNHTRADFGLPVVHVLIPGLRGPA